ncbi:glycosyltransferase family 2 protein [Phenylobacterium sp. LjRoot219]|uniref:glycosyltransferase family 2 protein n=1 Tax=Phenylobacterium sp. LjRoot219 TaxID=3342283 RepID=UPI003ECFAEBB
MLTHKPPNQTSLTAERRHAAAPPPLAGAGVWFVIPCYKVKAHILKVLAKTPAWVEGIVCVDDACPDGSGAFIREHAGDPRVVVVTLPKNLGVGGATMAGYREAERRGAQVLVKVDGDDQMDLSYAAHMVAPLLLGEADYAKGNRFTSISDLQEMPIQRVLGNAALSFAAKLSTGYWNIFDPTNGFTAIDAQVAKMVMRKRVSRRFFFETDLLYHLGTLRAVVRDVPIPARHADEISNLRISAIVGPFAFKHLRNFFQRVLGQYYVRDFNVASLELVSGLFLMLFGVGYAAHYIATRVPGQTASAGVVMAVALPLFLGAQLLLQAINFDVLNVPTRPIHPYLRTVARMERPGGAEERAG